jgi:hypothetical protein
MRSDVCEHERRVAQRDVRFAAIGEPRRTRAPVSVHVRRRPGRARSSDFQHVQSTRHAPRVRQSTPTTKKTPPHLHIYFVF